MNFIIFDLEATCWMGRPPHGINEIIEIGAVKVLCGLSGISAILMSASAQHSKHFIQRVL
jgi:hypothetical protein